MHKRIGLLAFVVILFILGGVFLNITNVATAQTDIQENQLTFTGRRGVDYTATWNTDFYTVTFTTPDSTFPWDWIGFVGQHGSVALSGYPNLQTTLDRSDPNALTGTMPGDLWRIKGSGTLSLAHLTKIGLIIGSGPTAQRAWFSDGTITKYFMAPHYVGYQVEVLGRSATVRLSSLNPQDYQAVILIQVTLDDPSNARLLLASDLEPAMDYATAVEPHNRLTSSVAFDSGSQIVSGTGGGYTTYVFASQPLQSWSANNLAFEDYLAADTLDGQLVSGSSDARIALSIAAQETQYFYLGSMALDAATRSDPTSAWYALRDARLADLQAMPQIEALALPRFEFANFLSNLILTYLINPNGGIFYTDKAFIYTPDVLMPLLVSTHTLPPGIQTAYRNALDLLSAQQYAGAITDRYSYKFDTHTWANLPSWYAGNIPDIIHFNPSEVRVSRESYSDGYATAEFVNSFYRYYLLTGDLTYLQSHASNINAALNGLLAFDSAYDAQYGQDGNLYPNLWIPMGDLGGIAGEYPAETAQIIYAYEDAAAILRLFGQSSNADSLINNYVTPMRAGYDTHFWDASRNYYMGIADQNSQAQTSGSTYNDWWGHVLFIPLRGNLGQSHQSDLLDVITGATFYEPAHDIHWNSTNSDHFANQTNLQNWWLSAGYTNGWGMEGGYLVLLNAIIPISYYQLDETGQAEIYANHYLDKWSQYGPFEVIAEYNNQMPGKIAEASMYIEAASANHWLLESALNLEVSPTEGITITPRLSGQFFLQNLNLTLLGQTAVIDYERDDQGDEYITIIRNDGLTIHAPNAQPRYAIRWGSYAAEGQDTFGFYDSDGATPLETNDLVQLIWTGPNGVIDPPGCNGLPGGDDVLLDINTINNGDPLPVAAQDQGYLPWKVYTYHPTDPQEGGTVYMRAWNAPNNAAATAYTETTPAPLSSASLLNVARQSTDQAQSTWTGVSGGNWHTATNWNTTAIPDDQTRVIIPQGTSLQLSANAAAGQLCIAAGASLNLNTFDLSVEETFNNAGTVHQTRTINAACTALTPCSFLQIQNGARTQNQYFGVEIIQTSAADLGETQVSVRGGQACGVGNGFTGSVQRCFEISPENPEEATITFYYQEAEANGNSAPQVYHYNTNTQTWDLQTFEARGGSGDALFVRAAGIDAYSPFALGTNGPTAVSLLDLGATSSGNQLALALAGICLGIGAILIVRTRFKKRTH